MIREYTSSGSFVTSKLHNELAASGINILTVRGEHPSGAQQPATKVTIVYDGDDMITEIISVLATHNPN